jgi:pimeloyl-ACP methyl ester carboxylesterase
MEQLRVSFSVPTGTTMPADGWPVVLYAHGTGGSYHSYRGRAQLLAEQGFAVIGVDQVLHGPRAPNVSPEIAFFNLQNPMAARYNTLQGALDNFQLVRLVEELDYTDTANSRTIRFDPDEIYFFGHSQGGLTGPPFLAHEPKVKGAVLSGAGGLLYLSLLYKTEPVDIAGLIGAFIRDFPLDEFNNILALLQGWIDYSDPASFARYLVREPRAGVGAKQIFQTEGFIDRYTPPPAIEALAVAIGTNLVAPVVEPVAGLELRGNQVLTAPVTGNQDGVTSVLLQYEEASGSDGHFVVFDLPAARTQSAEFLGSILRNGVATVPAVD